MSSGIHTPPQQGGSKAHHILTFTLMLIIVGALYGGAVAIRNMHFSGHFTVSMNEEGIQIDRPAPTMQDLSDLPVPTAKPKRTPEALVSPAFAPLPKHKPQPPAAVNDYYAPKE